MESGNQSATNLFYSCLSLLNATYILLHCYKFWILSFENDQLMTHKKLKYREKYRLKIDCRCVYFSLHLMVHPHTHTRTVQYNWWIQYCDELTFCNGTFVFAVGLLDFITEQLLLYIHDSIFTTTTKFHPH